MASGQTPRRRSPVRWSYHAAINVFATGGIGGAPTPAFDESADLIELARTPVIVVCTTKSVLTFPLPWNDSRHSRDCHRPPHERVPGVSLREHGNPVPTRFDDVGQIIAAHRAQRSLGHPAATLVVQAPPPADALPREVVERAIENALSAANDAKIRGPAMTPWLLSELGRATEGRTIRVNLALLESNARSRPTVGAAVAWGLVRRRTDATGRTPEGRRPAAVTRAMLARSHTDAASGKLEKRNR
jgi:pseudouridine-5'-phosphate glycosidase